MGQEPKPTGWDLMESSADDARCPDCGEKPSRPHAPGCGNAKLEAKQKGGYKDDSGKDPWHLVPWDAIRAIVKVLDFGSKKYAPRNWEAGMDWDRVFSALMRHLTAWYEREENDAETGFSHLWHAGCCIVFLISMEIRGIGKDTRPKK